jgi:DNA-binding MarR family transcriptional regulator
MSPEQDLPPDPKADLLETVFKLQQELLNTLRITSIPRWMELDLTMAQFKTLFVVAHRGPFTVNALAEILGVTQSTVSHLVDRLEQVQLVERVADADDRRRTLVQLAPSGAELVGKLHQTGESMRAMLTRLDIADLAALVRGLSAVLRAHQSVANGQPLDAPLQSIDKLNIMAPLDRQVKRTL